MSYSPDNNWVIQDLDMYPPQERVPSYTNVKAEVPMDNCGYSGTSSGRSQICAMTPSYPANSNSYNNVQYGVGPEPGYTAVQAGSSGEWPSDLDNILLDSNLPTECDSPLKLEDYNMEFVYVDPSTLDQAATSTSTTTQSSSFPSPTMCSQPQKYSNAPCGAQTIKPIQGQHPQQYYNDQPAFTAETIQPEMTSVPCIPGAQGQGRMMGTRGRPRNEWRITNMKPKKSVGRPRIKTGRVGRPPKDPIKKEIFDDEFDNLSVYTDDPSEEKKERRREQNRRAARKLREKKKVHVEKMKKDYEGIIQDNRRLTAEVRELKSLVEQLTQARDCHVCSCRDVTPSPASTTSNVPSLCGNGSDMAPYAISQISPELARFER